jgi:hypothetical protein
MFLIHGAEISHEEMGQRPTKAIKFPHHQAVTWPNEGECRSQASAITPTATGMVLEQVAFINAGSEQRVTLQIQHLTVAVGRDPHVADQHVRKTQLGRFSHSTPFRRGLSYRFSASRGAFQSPAQNVGNQVIPDTRGDPGLQLRSELNRLISLSEHITPFQLCPLMRTRRAFR